MEESQKVDGNERVEVVRREFRESFGDEDSGVVHQDIYGSKMSDRCFYAFRGGLVIANVSGDNNQIWRGAR